MIFVDIKYKAGPNLAEVAAWLTENFGGDSNYGAGGFCGNGWILYHTTIQKMPVAGSKNKLPYIITRGEFKKESDAILFKLRWS